MQRVIVFAEAYQIEWNNGTRLANNSILQYINKKRYIGMKKLIHEYLSKRWSGSGFNSVLRQIGA